MTPRYSRKSISCLAVTAFLLNGRHLANAFAGFSTTTTRTWHHLVEESTATTFRKPTFAWKRTTKLEASVVSDVQKSIPRNETSSDFSDKKGKKDSQRSKERRHFADDYLFNEALNELASKAGDVRQPVIRHAVACEDMWKDFCSAPEKKWQPDTVSFNTVLKAWAKAGGVLVDQHSDSSTPQYLLDPDVHIFTARDCAQRALDLLNQQDSLYDEMNEGEVSASIARPDVMSYNSVMDAWARSRTPEALPEVQALMTRMINRGLDPDRISFTILMEAHAFSDVEDRLDEVQKIWNHMESSEDPKVNPNAHSLVSLMHCYSRVASELARTRDDARMRQLSEQAMSFFQKQEKRYEESKNRHDLPGAYVYTSAMDVLAKVGTRDAAHRAEQLWQKLKMLEQQSDTDTSKDFRKTIYTYTAVISAWSRVTIIVPEASQRIADLLEELWQDDSVYLNPRPFAAALRGFARANYPLEDQPNKAIVALNLIKRMREAAKENPAVRPSRLVYHAALDCCSKSLSSHELKSALSKDGSAIESETVALKIAFALLQAMIADSITPNSETYSKLLLCTTYLLPVGDERTRIAESVFLKAKLAGVADKDVLRSFQKAADSTYWNDFIEAEQLVNERGHIDWRKLPRAWSKNVR